MPEQLSDEDIAFLKSKGIDPSTVQFSEPASEGMSTGKAIGSTLKAHAGGILGGGIGTLAGVALAPETGGLSLAIPIALGLAGSYAGQKGQQAILPEDVNQQLQQESEQAIKEHPIASIGTDVAASALASGGKFSPGTVLKALRGDSPALARIALQSGLNTAIDTGVTAATEHRLPSLSNIGADIAGGALFSEPSSLGRLAHRAGSEPLYNPDVVRPPLNGPIEPTPQVMSSYQRPGETSPSGISDSGRQPKSVDTVTQNKMADTNVTGNPIDKKPLLTPTEQSLIMDMNNRTVGEGTENVGRSGLSKVDEQQVKNDPSYFEHQQFTPQIYSPEDLDRYNKLNMRMRELTRTIDGINSPEFAKVWQDFEQVRNKYGGMPPAQKPIMGETGTMNAGQGSVEDTGLVNIAQYDKEFARTHPSYQQLRNFVQSTIDEDDELKNRLNAWDKAVPNDEKGYAEMLGTIINSDEGKYHSPTISKYLQENHPDVYGLIKDVHRPFEDKLKDFALSHMIKNGEDAHVAQQALDDPQRWREIRNEVEPGLRYWIEDNVFNETEKIKSRIDNPISSKDEAYWGLESPYQKGPNKNAIQESSPSSVLQHPQEGAGVEGSERGRVEQSIEGKETPEEGLPKETAQKEEGGQPPESPVTKVAPADIEYHTPYKAGTWAVVDKVHDLPHPGAAPLADATKQTLNERDKLIGQWKNPIVESGQSLTARDKEGLQKVMDTELSSQQVQPGLVSGLSKRAQQFYQLAKGLLDKNADYRIQSGEPVYQGNLPRALQKVPWYWPGMPNQKVEQTYRTNTDQAAIQKLDQTFDKWNQQSLGMTPEGSKKAIEDFKTAVRGNRGSSEISHQDYFNASRRAMGLPLPPEFREGDIVKNLSRYFDRQAIDNSHYRFLEKNPKAMAALGETKDAWGKDIPVKYNEGSLTGNEQVRALLKQFRPDIESKSEQTEGSVSGLFTSSLISGPTLESHKVLSNQIGAISQTDNPYQAVRALTHAITNINEGWQHAKEGGLVKLSAHSSLDMFNGQLAAAQRWNGLSKAIRDISTLGGLTTKLNAGMLQSFMESLVPSKLIRANNGDITAQRWIRRLDPTYRPGKTYQPAEMRQLATLAAQYTHGTGDIRSLPAVMMQDSELSGFLSLAHWSVSQTTNFQHNVWEPATRGNYTPLLTGIFGASVGGYLIRELREQMSGKKTGIPSLSEIASSQRGLAGNSGPLMYNAISAMQYAGFGGLISQIAKYPFDFVYKNQPQGATFPLDQITTDMVGTLRNVTSAIANDPNLNWVDLAKAVTGHILSTDMQLSRIALNQGINAGLVHGTVAEKKLLADKMAQLRRFDMVEGLPYNDIDSSSNPFMNIEQQKFKHDPDVGEAVGMLPQMMNNIIQRYGSNPDVMMQKLKGLKENVYQTFPSMESTPMQFFKYLNYLGRLEGPEKAQELLQDYMTRRIQNQVKGSVVP